MTRVLLIGGTESSGGAGLGRDVATATALGAETALAVTAVTAQTDAGVQAIHPIPPETVAAQVGAAGPVGAVKTGMLVDAATVHAVAGALPAAPLVVDPVVAASSGRALLDGDGLAALLEHMVPRAELITPNRPEFASLTRHLGVAPSEPDGIRALLSLGCRAVLLKGGHAAGDICEDRLYLAEAPETPIRFSGPRHPVSLRGTGCRLGSAIAAGLAAKQPVADAIRQARNALDHAFRTAMRRADDAPTVRDQPQERAGHPRRSAAPSPRSATRP